MVITRSDAAWSSHAGLTMSPTRARVGTRSPRAPALIELMTKEENTLARDAA